MATNYTTQGFWQIRNVTFTGTEGDAGSILHWDGRLRSDADLDIIDHNDNGQLDAGLDEFVHTSNAGTELFTGYTITAGGVEYGIFSTGSAYFVPLPHNGVGSTLLPDSGSSNAWQSQTSGTTFLCFAKGTLIATPSGEARIETLRIGDMVRTADGRTVPVKWIGRQTVAKLFAGLHAQLVRIRAGVLGNHTDLCVTADHGMIIDDLVINAAALINGRSIDWVPMAETPDRFTVYHIETEAHDVILANGAPAETFIDIPGRAAFDNYAEYLALYGAERIIPEMPRPRISAQRLVPEVIKARLGIVGDVDFGLAMSGAA